MSNKKLFDKPEDFNFETVEDILRKKELNPNVDHLDNLYTIQFLAEEIEPFADGALKKYHEAMENNEKDKASEFFNEWRVYKEKYDLVMEAHKTLREKGNEYLREIRNE